MSFKLQIIIALIILAGLIVLVNLIRKNKLELKYALSWIFLGAGILIFDLFPGLTSFLASLLLFFAHYLFPHCSSLPPF